MKLFQNDVSIPFLSIVYAYAEISQIRAVPPTHI